MRILMVTAYPPARDGIANYAVQAVARLGAEGHDVEVLSPGPSAAHHHLDLVGWRGPLALARRLRAYDKVIVQFHPDFFYPQPSSTADLVAVSLALAAAFRVARRVEVVAHEPNYQLGRGAAPSPAVRAMWRSADRILVHTEPERQAFLEAFDVPPERVAVTEHGADFVRRTSLDRTGARLSLGIPPDAFMFLAIGFIQPHKGFDRAIRAFAGLGRAEPGGCRLDIVGSVRTADPAHLEHLEELRRLGEGAAGVTVHEHYVGDEEFDRWMVASDVVVLPYRHIWSSSVMERAALYGRPVIATRTGGLQNQARSDTTLVDDDRQLAAAMRKAARSAGTTTAEDAAGGEPPGWDFDGEVTAQTVMAEVRARASARRPSPRPVDARRHGGAVEQVSVALRRLPPLTPPAPVSARLGATSLKRLLRRLTAWELDPIRQQLNRLQAATVESVESLGAAHARDDDGSGGG